MGLEEEETSRREKHDVSKMKSREDAKSWKDPWFWKDLSFLSHGHKPKKEGHLKGSSPTDRQPVLVRATPWSFTKKKEIR